MIAIPQNVVKELHDAIFDAHVHDGEFSARLAQAMLLVGVGSHVSAAQMLLLAHATARHEGALVGSAASAAPPLSLIYNSRPSQRLHVDDTCAATLLYATCAPAVLNCAPVFDEPSLRMEQDCIVLRRMCKHRHRSPKFWVKGTQRLVCAIDEAYAGQFEDMQLQLRDEHARPPDQ